MNLTTKIIDEAQPKEKNYRLHDTKGLYIEISKSGGKWWRFKYRFNQKENRISLGLYPEISLTKARVRRNDARVVLAHRVDPAEYRKIIRALKGVSAAARKLLLENITIDY